MNRLIKVLLAYYYYLIKFFESCLLSFNSYKLNVFEGEVVFKGILDERKGFIVKYDRESLWYVCWAVMLNMLGLSHLRWKEHYNDIEYQEGVWNVYTYVKDKSLKGGLFNSAVNAVDNLEHPNALYVVVNDKYNVSHEYDIFRTAMNCFALLTYEVAEILVMYKYRHQHRPTGFWYKLILVDKQTLKEFTFKADSLLKCKDDAE